MNYPAVLLQEYIMFCTILQKKCTAVLLHMKFLSRKYHIIFMNHAVMKCDGLVNPTTHT